MAAIGRPRNLVDYDDENIQMFVSSAAMETEIIIKTKNGETFCKRMELEREYSEETKRKHEQIIRKLLEEFDLEHTKDKYRTGKNVEYRPPSTGLENIKFREELIRLMGSDVIRINDRKWNEEFHRRIQEEYHRNLDHKEKLLADAEEERIRKLKLEGLMPMTDDENNDKLSGKKSYRKKKNSKKSSTKKRNQNGTHDRYSVPLLHSQEERYRSSERIETQIEIEAGATEKISVDEADNGEDVKDNSKTDEKQLVETEEPDSRTPRHYRKHKIPCEMTSLYEEESVHGLYSVAARLIPSK